VQSSARAAASRDEAASSWRPPAPSSRAPFYRVATLVESRFHLNVVLTAALVATFPALGFDAI
jgi:hypothetical protein